MILALKILALWTLASVAAGIIIGPVLQRLWSEETLPSGYEIDRGAA